MANWMSTGSYLVVSIKSCRPITLEKGTEKYEKVLSLLTSSASDDDLIAALDVGKKIGEFSNGDFSVDRDSGVVTFDGHEVHDTITERIVQFCKSDLPYLPLLNFWRNVQNNPSDESKRHLFLFLEANKMPITHDGCFLAYKGVKKDRSGDFVDKHTGKFCNNIGSVVTMNRENVNPDRNTTCSQGLHVASLHYAKETYGGDVILEVKVNPCDVVAVPCDYNNEKMRVCRYEVVGISTGEGIDSDAVQLVDRSTERAIKKNATKSQKQSKKKIRREAKEEHRELVERLKKSISTDTISFDSLTASEIIVITNSLYPSVVSENLFKLDRKNKKTIVRKAKELLEDAGFKVI